MSHIRVWQDQVENLAKTMGCGLVQDKQMGTFTPMMYVKFVYDLPDRYFVDVLDRIHG